MVLTFHPVFWLFPNYFPPRAQDNIQKVMKEIDHVVSYHNIVKMRQGKEKRARPIPTSLIIFSVERKIERTLC